MEIVAALTVEECDKRLDVCRRTLATLQVRSSRLIVWEEIDSLLEQRVKLARKAKKLAA